MLKWFAFALTFLPLITLAEVPPRSIDDIDQNLRRLDRQAPELLTKAKARVLINFKGLEENTAKVLAERKTSLTKRPAIIAEVVAAAEKIKLELSDFIAADSAKEVFTNLLSEGRPDGKAITLVPVGFSKLEDLDDGKIVADWFLHNDPPLGGLDIRVLRLKGLQIAAGAYAAGYRDPETHTTLPRNYTVDTSIGALEVVLPIEMVNHEAFVMKVVEYLFGSRNLLLLRADNENLSGEEIRGLMAHEVQHLYDSDREPFLNSVEYQASEQKYLNILFSEKKNTLLEGFTKFETTKEFGQFRADITDLVRDSNPSLDAKSVGTQVDKILLDEFWRYTEGNFNYFGRLKETRGFHKEARFSRQVSGLTLAKTTEADRNATFLPTEYRLRNGRKLSIRSPDYPLHQNLFAGLFDVERAPTNPIYEFYTHLRKQNFTLVETAALADLLIDRSKITAKITQVVDQLKRQPTNVSKETTTAWIKTKVI